MVRGDAAKATPRIRNKITNKTRLRIVHGDIDIDRTFVEDDAHDGKNLATGVDAEDANEYHLQAILAAANAPTTPSTSTFCQPSANRKASSISSPTAPPTATAPLHIPTPDATGKVDNYASLYTPGRWEPPILLAKFSDTVEEAAEDSLANGYTYVMDERDSDWLEKNNKSAKGEGPSSRVEATPNRRGTKARGKEPEPPAATVITEDEFELIMGVFEKLADDKVPFLHLAVNEFPPFSDFEPFFATSLPLHFFPQFTVPLSVPLPEQMCRLARAIYPYWRDRKTERGGRRVIPQLNYDDSNEGDPYVCFRRREAKPVRKTRRQDTTSVDRMVKLKAELEQVQNMARCLLDREQEKVNLATEARNVNESRVKLIDLKRRFTALATANDDELFTERMLKKPRVNDLGPHGTIKIRRNRDSMESQSGQGTPQEITNPLEKAARIMAHVDQFVAKQKNPFFEDVTENAFQPPGLSLSQRHFRSISDGRTPSTLTSFDSSTSVQPPRSGHPISYRSRMGRGGRLLLDRRLTARRHPIDDPSPYKIRHDVLLQAYPGHSSQQTKQEAPDSATQSTPDEDDRTWKMQERWRYDSDAGVSIGGLSGVLIDDEEETRLIVDDYEPSRMWHVRKSLLSEEEMSWLRIDDYQFRKAEAAYETRLEKAAAATNAALELAEKVRREQVSRSTPTSQNIPPTPSTPQPGPSQPISHSVPVSTALGTPNGVAASNNAAVALAQAKKLQIQHAKSSRPLVNGIIPQPPPPQPSQSINTPIHAALPNGNGTNANLKLSLPVAPPQLPTTAMSKGPGLPSSPPSESANGLSSPSFEAQSGLLSGLDGQPNGVANAVTSHVPTGTNGMANGLLPSTAHMLPANGGIPPGANTGTANGALSSQQALGLKNVFASQLQQGQLAQAPPAYPTSNWNFPGSNISLKLPPRQAPRSSVQRPNSLIVGSGTNVHPTADGAWLDSLSFNPQNGIQIPPGPQNQSSPSSAVGGHRLNSAAVPGRGSPRLNSVNAPQGRSSPNGLVSHGAANLRTTTGSPLIPNQIAHSATNLSNHLAQQQVVTGPSNALANGY